MSQANGVYNNYATSVANKSRVTKELADKFSRLLLNKPFDQLASKERAHVLMAVTAAQRSAGGIFGADPTQYFNTLYGGITASSFGLPVSGLGTGKASTMYGTGPEAMLAAGQLFSSMDTYLHGNREMFKSGTSTGLSGAAAAGYLAQYYQARGGIQHGEMQRFALGSNALSQFETVDRMHDNTRMTREESQQVYSTMLNAQMLDMYARDNAQTSYIGADAMKQDELAEGLKKKLAEMSKADREKYQQKVLKELEDRFKHELTAAHKKDGKWDEGWDDKKVTAEVSRRMAEVRHSGASAELTDQGVDSAIRTLEGRSEVVKGTKELDSVTRKALATVDRTLSEMTEVFGTDQYDELMAQANKFGITTLASEQQVKKMRTIIDSARARAAATGRTVQEVMVEYGQVAELGASLFGGAQYMPAHFLDTYSDMDRASRGNVASGFDTRTDEERAAAHAARMANDAEYYGEAVWALDHGKDSDERMKYWNERLMTASTNPLTEEERKLMLADTAKYVRDNGAGNTAEFYKAHYGTSATAGVVSDALMVGDRETHGTTEAEGISMHWLQHKDSLAYKRLIGSGKLGANEEESTQVVEQALKDAVHEFGGDNASLQAQFGKEGVVNKLMIKHGRDAEAVKKELGEEMRAQGRSEEDIARYLNLVDTFTKLDGGAQQSLLEGVAGVQRSGKITAESGAAFRHKNRQQELEAQRALAEERSKGIVKRLGGNDLGAFLVHGKDATEEADLLATTYATFSSAGKHVVAADDGDIDAATHNELLRKSDDELKAEGFSDAMVDRMRTMRGNQLALQADKDTGNFKAEFARQEAQALNSKEADLKKAIEQTPPGAEQDKLKKQLKQIQERQALFHQMTGITTQDMVTKARTDEEFTNAVNKNRMDRGLSAGARDENGDAIMSADSLLVTESKDVFKREAMVKMLTHMDHSNAVGLDPKTVADAKKGDAAAIETLLTAAGTDDRVQALLDVANATGGSITVDDKGTLKIGDHMATTIADQNRLIYKTAKGREGGSQALIDKAKAGDKAALAALNQSAVDTHLRGQTKAEMNEHGVGFNYLALAKQLESEIDGKEFGGKEIKFTEADVDAVREVEKRYDAILRKAREGTATVAELEELNPLKQRLDELTMYSKDNEDMQYFLKEEGDLFGKSADAKAFAATKKWAHKGEDVMAQRDEERDAEQKAAAEAQKRAEEEAEYRKIMINIAKRVERTMDNDRITVQTDSW